MTQSPSGAPVRPLRIAVFHDLPSGGAKRTLHAQVGGLRARGHRVSCFTTSNAEEDLFPLREVAHEMTVIPVPAPPDRERTLAGRPRPSDLLTWSRVFLGLRQAQKAVARAVDEGDFDILLAHPSQFTQAPHLLGWTQVPSVYYCHEILRAAHEPRISTPTVRGLIRITLGRVDRRNARRASVILVNSEFTRKQVLGAYGCQASVVPPGVDLRRFHPSGAGRGDYVLAVGALHPLKGMDFIVESLSRIPLESRPRLILISDRARERERQRLLAATRRLNVQVELRERVSDETLPGLYAGARALLFAAHREPLGLVPLEAMACGTPVVAVAEGGVRETVVDGVTGHLTPRDREEFARAVRELLDHPETGEEMGRRGRIHVEEHWSWERSLDGLTRTLESLVDAHG